MSDKRNEFMLSFLIGVILRFGFFAGGADLRGDEFEEMPEISRKGIGEHSLSGVHIRKGTTLLDTKLSRVNDWDESRSGGSLAACL